MFDLKQWFVNWFYPELKKKDDAQEVALAWHPVPKCQFCGRPLMVENCHYCMHCGLDLSERHTTEPERHTTAHSKLVLVPEHSPSITDLISVSWDRDNERLLAAFNHKIKPVKWRNHE